MRKRKLTYTLEQINNKIREIYDNVYIVPETYFGTTGYCQIVLPSGKKVKVRIANLLQHKPSLEYLETGFKVSAQQLESKLKEINYPYSFIKETYKGISKKCTFIDPDFGTWEVTPHMVLSQQTLHPKRGRIKGDKNRRKDISTIKEKLKQAHNDNVILDESSYISIKKKCIFIDKIYGKWQATPDMVIGQKTRHPKYIESKCENECRRVLEKIFNKKFIKCRPKWLKNPKTNYCLELDGYCEELKLAFEYDGYLHFENKFNTLDYQKYKDKIKDDLCAKFGIKLLRINCKLYDIENFINRTVYDQR